MEYIGRDLIISIECHYIEEKNHNWFYIYVKRKLNTPIQLQLLMCSLCMHLLRISLSNHSPNHFSKLNYFVFGHFGTTTFYFKPTSKVHHHQQPIYTSHFCKLYAMFICFSDPIFCLIILMSFYSIAYR